MGQVSDKVAIVTGAARGMGEAHARLLAKEGAKIILTDVLESGEKVAAELGAAAHFMMHDVTDAEAWARVVAEGQRHFGRIDILVNNAGIFGTKSLLETTAHEMEHLFKVNVLSVMLGMQAVFEPMKAGGKGSIINISSVSALRNVPGQLAYATSKWAVRGMSGCAAAEFGRHGIRVNTICPGIIDTPMTAANPEDQNAQAESLVPLGRRGASNDVAAAVLFLASDAACYVNGAELSVDGGVRL